MSSRFIIFLAAIFITLTASMPARANYKLREELIADYINTYPSFEQLLKSYVVHEVITAQDLTTILAFLKTRLVPAIAKPIPIRFVGGAYVAGTFGWTNGGDGYKTLRGRIFKIEGSRASTHFQEIFNALGERTVSRNRRLLIDDAKAATIVTEIIGRATAASVFLMDRALRANGGNQVLGSVIQGLALPLRKYIFETPVLCSRLNRKLVHATKKFHQPSVNTVAACPKTETPATSICKFARAAESLRANFSGDSGWTERIDDAKIKKILRTDDVPECDSRTSGLVQRALSTEVEALFTTPD
jgi:hypothetical protein